MICEKRVDNIHDSILGIFQSTQYNKSILLIIMACAHVHNWKENSISYTYKKTENEQNCTKWSKNIHAHNII